MSPCREELMDSDRAANNRHLTQQLAICLPLYVESVLHIYKIKTLCEDELNQL